jgi:3-oxoacyl-ACP reductase-like protein
VKGIAGLAALLALVFAGVTHASAQTLGEIARQEAERRKAIKSSGKVITNESLRREVPPEPAPGTSAPAAPGSGAPAAPAAPAPAAAPPAADEATWKKRMTDARDALRRSQMFAEALQTRINALSTDFVNRDDPAQRDQIAGDRQSSLAELERVKSDIAAQQKAIQTIRDDARKAGVPAGWVR